MGGQDEATEIERLARHLVGGRVAVIPTETFYGLAADPRSAVGVARLLDVKGRAAGHSLPLIAGAREQVDVVAPGWSASPRALVLAKRFWPGPLSLILDAAGGLAAGVAAEDGSVAVRWTSHPTAASLARAAGTALVATSANRSGEPPHRRAREAWASLGHPPDVLVLDVGPAPGGLPSALVDVRRPGLKYLRPAAIAEEAVRLALREARL